MAAIRPRIESRLTGVIRDRNGRRRALLTAVLPGLVGLILLLSGGGSRVRGADCNQNGTPDASELGGLNPYLFTALPVPVDGVPLAIAAGDLNGDRLLDVVTANYRLDENVYSPTGHSVLLQQPGGGFLESHLAVAGNGGIVAADFNADRLVDLVAGGLLFPGRGDGTFAEPLPLPVLEGFPDPPGVCDAADLDNNGVLDLRVNYFTLQPYRIESRVLLSNKDGTFSVQPSVPCGSSSGLPVYSGIGDLDRDGILDLATTTQFTSEIRLYRGKGNGDFEYFGDLRARDKENGGLAAADVNGDGYDDLLVVDHNPVALGLYLNSADGTFRARVDVMANVARAPVAADFNADGLVDLVSINSFYPTNSLWLLTGRGNGSFKTPLTLPRNVGEYDPFVVADLDANGLPDIALAHRDGSEVLIYWNRSILSHDCNRNGIPDACDLRDGTSADIDENGIPDGCQPDCNQNEVPDRFEVTTGQSPDCNHNASPDACDIASRRSLDNNSNAIPDECEGGLRLPGDANGDGRFDISDSVAALGVLFLGEPARFPCGDGSPRDPANISLMDWQPDGAVDISDAVATLNFLFLGGNPHTLAVPGSEATTCVPVEGCGDTENCN